MPSQSPSSSPSPNTTHLTSPLLLEESETTTSITTQSQSHLPHSNYDSLDFERIINVLTLPQSSIYTTQTKKRHLLGYSGRTSTRWVLTIITALSTGLCAITIVWSIERLTGFREYLVTKSLEHTTSSNGEASRYDSIYIYVLFTLWNLFLATLSSSLSLTFAPSSIGSGIPQIKSYLNGIKIPDLLNIETFIFKIVGTILSVSSGLCVGPEGPLVHLGAMVGAGLTRTGKINGFVQKVEGNFPTLSKLLGVRYVKKTLKYLTLFKNDTERSSLISIGSSCGFASAFGSPIGGLLFSLEECSSFFTKKMLWRTIVGTMISTFCLAVYYGDLTRYGVLSLEGIQTGDGNIAVTRFMEIPLYVGVGVLGGVAGGVFNAVWEAVNLFRENVYNLDYLSGKNRASTAPSSSSAPKRQINKRWKIIEVGVLSVLTSTVTFMLPLYCPWSCKDVVIVDNNNNENLEFHQVRRILPEIDDVSDTSNTTIQTGPLSNSDFALRFNCLPNQTNELASIFFGSRETAIKQILASPDSFDPRTLLVVGLTFFGLLSVTFGAAIPCGLFMPTIIVGASLGGYIGIVIKSKIIAVSPSTFALVGAVALLGGIQRSTVSLCVIIMEGTGQIKFLIPIVITTVVARWVGDLFGKGIYEVGMAIRGLPYLEHHVHQVYDLYKISDVMSSPVITLRLNETASNVEKVLKSCYHNGFPVIDDEGMFKGIVRRDQLVALIQCRFFKEEEEFDSNENLESMAMRSTSDTFYALANGNDCNFGISSSLKRDLRRRGSESDLTVRNGNDNVEDYDGLLNNNNSDGETSSDEDEDAAYSRLNVSVTGLEVTPQQHSSLFNHSVSNSTDDSATGGLRRRRRGKSHKNIVKVLGAGGGTQAGLSGILTIDVNAHDKARIIDVGSVMNIAPHVVLEDTPLSRGYRLFANLGLRHLLVLGGRGEVKGIVTRDNFTDEGVKERLKGRYS